MKLAAAGGPAFGICFMRLCGANRLPAFFDALPRLRWSFYSNNAVFLAR